MNQPYDNMSLQSTQPLCPTLHGIMRDTREGRESIQVAATEGTRELITRRNGPFGDYNKGAPEDPPRRKRNLGL